MDLTTTHMGLQFDNPLIVGASPLSDDADAIRRCEDAGASAVVMHSLFMEQITREQLHVHDHVDIHLDAHAEALSFFPAPHEYALGPDEYLEQVSRLKETVSMPVIASLNGITTGPWTRYARLVEQAGADGIELNVYYLPLDGEEKPGQAEQRYLDILAAVKERVDIPVAMKLTYFFSSPVHLAKRLDAAGADGLVLFNQVFHADIDVDSLELVPTLHLSTPGALRLRLLWLAAMFGRIDASLAVSGGVHNALGAIKAVMAGADVVQMTSALLEHGPLHLRRVRREMSEWMEDHEYESLQQMRGNMSLLRCPDPEAFERGNYMRTLQKWRPPKSAPAVKAGGFWGPAASVPRAPRRTMVAPDRGASHKEIARLLEVVAASTTADSARSALDELETRLRAHFHEEEGVDGVFDWVCALAPHLGDQTEELTAGHQDLLHELDAVRDAGLRDEVALERIERFVEHVRDHERRERNLVRTALKEDAPPRPFPYR